MAALPSFDHVSACEQQASDAPFAGARLYGQVTQPVQFFLQCFRLVSDVFGPVERQRQGGGVSHGR